MRLCFCGESSTFTRNFEIAMRLITQFDIGRAQQQFGITDCILETQSSNCGNNVRNAWALLQEKGIKANSIIIMQDSSMQLRMDAIFKKVWQPADTSIINFCGLSSGANRATGKLVFCTQ